MNQLNKLIEQYPGDKHWVKVAIKNLTGSVWEFDKELVKFLEFLATRPTCGVEQRKFLDEIEKLELDDDGDLLYGILGHTIFQSQFKANLTEVQNGK